MAADGGYASRITHTYYAFARPRCRRGLTHHVLRASRCMQSTSSRPAGLPCVTGCEIVFLRPRAATRTRLERESRRLSFRILEYTTEDYTRVEPLISRSNLFPLSAPLSMYRAPLSRRTPARASSGGTPRSSAQRRGSPVVLAVAGAVLLLLSFGACAASSPSWMTTEAIAATPSIATSAGEGRGWLVRAEGWEGRGRAGRRCAGKGRPPPRPPRRLRPPPPRPRPPPPPP